MRADTISGIMRHQFGEFFMFSQAPQEPAEACEVRPDIGDWLEATSGYSEAMALLWSRTKPILDSTAAARAIESMGLLNRPLNGGAPGQLHACKFIAC